METHITSDNLFTAASLLKLRKGRQRQPFCNLKGCDDPKVFLVDHYLNEMAVLRSLWPESKILLCPWHVRRAFKSNISSLSLPQEKNDEIRKII